ncbi:MAG TPA: hypothetical protein VML96_04380 [Egibacteraceae bacterium]|nr:hypothetical protein [Egibacteraceae bacterium]
MKWVIAALLVLALLAAADRFLLWVESRGWLFYRRRKASSSSASNAMLELHAIFEPEKHHVVVERREMELDEAEAGDPPKHRESNA